MTSAQLKASVLDLAIRGELVPQNPNEESAKELLVRVRVACLQKAKGVRARRISSGISPEEMEFNIPSNWQWCRLEELVMSPISYGIIKLGDEVVDGIKVLRSSDVKPGYIDESKIRAVSRQLSDEFSRTILSGGEIVINVRGTLGGCACVPPEYKGYNVAREVAVIDYNKELSGKYLMWCLLSNYFWKYMTGNLKGIAYKGLNIGKLAQFPVPIPPLAEQNRIVTKIEKLMPIIDRYGVAETRRQKLDAALGDNLYRSILQEAFAGRLVKDCEFENMPLDKACEDVYSGNSLSETLKMKFAKTEGLPFIGTKDIRFDQNIAYANGIRIPKTEKGFRTAPSGATLLCIEGGSSGRKIGLLDQDVRFGNKLCAFLPGDKLNPGYLFLYLQSPQFLMQFSDLQNGPRKGAGISAIKQLTIPVVDKDKQNEIVEKALKFVAVISKIKGTSEKGAK